MVDSPESYPNALRLLHGLKANMELISEDVPLAQLNHPLAVFSGNPAGNGGWDYDGDWEVLTERTPASSYPQSVAHEELDGMASLTPVIQPRENDSLRRFRKSTEKNSGGQQM